jgi:hypothetical protein
MLQSVLNQPFVVYFWTAATVLFGVWLLLPALLFALGLSRVTIREEKGGWQLENASWPIALDTFHELNNLGLRALGSVRITRWPWFALWFRSQRFRVFGAGPATWFLLVWRSKNSEPDRLLFVTFFDNYRTIFTSNCPNLLPRWSRTHLFRQLEIAYPDVLLTQHRLAVDSWPDEGTRTAAHDNIATLLARFAPYRRYFLNASRDQRIACLFAAIILFVIGFTFVGWFTGFDPVSGLIMLPFIAASIVATMWHDHLARHGIDTVRRMIYAPRAKAEKNRKVEEDEPMPKLIPDSTETAPGETATEITNDAPNRIRDRLP